MKIHDINPLHFYDSSAYPTETNNVFPNIANQKIGVDCQEGEYSLNYLKEIPSGSELVLILIFEDESELLSKTFSIKYNNKEFSDELIIENITPTGWLNSIIGKITVTIGFSGAETCYIHDEGDIISDTIAISDSSHKSKLLKLHYFNSENAFGVPFNDADDINQIQQTAYFTGKVIAGEPQIELEIFEGQGYSELLKSTIFKTYSCELLDINHVYLPIITQIFGLDRIFINDTEMQISKSGMSFEKKGNTDLYDIKFKTTLKENDYNSI